MAEFTVTTAADVVDAGDGVLSLREAVNQANAAAAADRIVFADPLEGRTLTLTQGQLALSADVAVDGDKDDDGTQVSVSGGGASRVFEVTGAGVALADLGIRDGAIDEGEGGGIRLSGGGSSLAISGCTVEGNAVGAEDDYRGGGGAIFAGAGSRLTVTNSVISDNEAERETFAGGIFGVGAAVTISGSVVEGNNGYGGGGIAVIGGSRLVLDRSTVDGNLGAFYKGGEGGGIYAADSRVELRRSTISDNFSRYDGGGILLRNADATIDNCTVAGNSCRDFYGYGATAGIAVVGGSLSLSSSTVTGNTSEGYAGGPGGILVAGDVSIANSIVSGNFGSYLSEPQASDVENDGSVTSNGRNIFGTNVAGSVAGDLENVEASRIFASIDPDTGGGQLALNGGPTRTAALRDAVDNPALSGAAPAASGAVDQRGAARPQPGTSNPDIGAFELNQTALSTTASSNNDVLTGTAAANTLAGLAGADLVSGRGGDDRLYGNDGSDTLRGGAGNDLLEGGLGRDVLDGGAGRDRVSYFNDDYPLGLTIDLDSGRAFREGEQDRLFGIENADGSNSADTLYGDEFANRLGGAAGVDRLFGRDGDDVLAGGLGNDGLFGDAGFDLVDFAAGAAVNVDLRSSSNVATRGSEVDTLRGIEGAIGSGSADTLTGDAGANLFRGQGGMDTMTGGAGADSFDFDATAQSAVGVRRDVVTDFTAGSDELDLATIDARSATPGTNEAFTFLSARGAAFTGAGQVRWYQSGGDTFVEANVDANLAADMQIQLSGLKTMTAGDFLL